MLQSIQVDDSTLGFELDIIRKIYRQRNIYAGPAEKHKKNTHPHTTHTIRSYLAQAIELKLHQPLVALSRRFHGEKPHEAGAQEKRREAGAQHRHEEDPSGCEKRREAGAQEKRRGAGAQLRHEEDPSGDGEKRRQIWMVSYHRAQPDVAWPLFDRGNVHDTEDADWRATRSQHAAAFKPIKLI